MRQLLMAGLLPALLLSACSSDPKTEAPVDLAPGLYALSERAGPDIYVGDLKLAKDLIDAAQVCIPAGRTKDFWNVALKALDPHTVTCGRTNPVRTGNHLEGTRSCRYASANARGSITLPFVARVEEEAFRIEGEAEVVAVTAISARRGGTRNRVDSYVLTGKRIGDC